MKRRKTMKIKLFTHTDLDGVGCAIVAKHAFEDVDYTLCEYKDINEKVTEFITSQAYKDYERAFITDISVNDQVAEYIEMINQDLNREFFMLFDHHPTALDLNKYKWANVTVEHTAGTKASGTTLFDLQLIAEGHLSHKMWDLGQFTEKVRRYDTWEWMNKYDDTHAKQLNDLLYIIGQSKFIKRFAADSSIEFTEGELLLLEVEEKRIESYINSKRKELVKSEAHGYKIGYVFADQNQSILGNTLAKENLDVDLIVMIDPGSRKLSYRAVKDEVDVSTLAQMFGGGGHPKASGSQIEGSIVDKWIEDVFSTLVPKKEDPVIKQLRAISEDTAYIVISDGELSVHSFKEGD
jgi:oligoribonuclease NrnB/cAMP/cGMP phosphodiesterase (DHH superfamily)